MSQTFQPQPSLFLLVDIIIVPIEQFKIIKIDSKIYFTQAKTKEEAILSLIYTYSVLKYSLHNEF